MSRPRSSKYLRKNRRRVSLIAIALVVLAVLALVSVAYLGVLVARSFSGGSLKVVEVPKLVGLDLQTAEKKLEEVGLRLRIKDSAYSDEIEAGKIINQSPLAGLKVREGKIVQVIKSLGKPKVIIPDVVGVDFAKAQSLLTKARLRVGKVIKVFRKDVERGMVIYQNPEAGQVFPNPVKVDLVVADSPSSGQVVVPEVVGLKLEEAEGIIADANLVLSKVKYVYEGIQPELTVIKQEPEANEVVQPLSNVRLTVELGEKEALSLARVFTVRFKMPAHLPPATLAIEIEDVHGKSVIYKDEIAPGELIEQSVSTEGSCRIRIYLNGKLIREDEV